MFAQPKQALPVGFTKCVLLCTLFILALASPGQEPWQPGELESAYNLKETAPTLQLLEKKATTPYDFGIKLLRNGKSQMALAWFQQMTTETLERDEQEAQQYLFGFACVRASLGDITGALEDLDLILTRDPKPLLIARANYLKGQLIEQNQEALHYFEKAISEYTKLGLVGGQYRVKKRIAATHLALGDLETANRCLTQLDELKPKIVKRGINIPHEGLNFELKGELLLARGDFQGAVQQFKKGRQLYQAEGLNHQSDMLEAKIALFTLASGFPAEAHRLAEALVNKCKSTNNLKVAAYNAITLIKLSLCANQTDDAAYIEQSFHAWLKDNPDNKEILNLLVWAKSRDKFPCPEWK